MFVEFWFLLREVYHLRIPFGGKEPSFACAHSREILHHSNIEGSSLTDGRVTFCRLHLTSTSVFGIECSKEVLSKVVVER